MKDPIPFIRRWMSRSLEEDDLGLRTRWEIDLIISLYLGGILLGLAALLMYL